MLMHTSFCFGNMYKKVRNKYRIEMEELCIYG